jgi:hypothetical protein
MREVLRHITLEQTQPEENTRDDAYRGDRAPRPQTPHHIKTNTQAFAGYSYAGWSSKPMSQPAHAFLDPIGRNAAVSEK